MTNTAWTTELSSETECFYLYSLDEIGIDLYATGYAKLCHDTVAGAFGRTVEVKISSSLTQRLKNKRANTELPPWQRRAILM